MGKYILRGHEPMACPDLILWGLWFESADRIVQQDQIGDYWVSTVFLGIDHNFSFTRGPQRRPILFETMTFIEKPHRDENGKAVSESDGCERYSTLDEALAGHLATCERLRNSG